MQRGDVAFACEGDVSFYGTFTYLAQAVQRLNGHVKISAIAGVSSPMAAAAAAHIPLTCQSDKLAILPALYSFNSGSNRRYDSCLDSQNELEAALEWADVVILMKVSSVYAQVWDILQRHQLLERSVVIENATRADERVWIDLHNYPELKLPYFSLLIVQRANRTVV